MASKKTIKKTSAENNKNNEMGEVLNSEDSEGDQLNSLRKSKSKRNFKIPAFPLYYGWILVVINFGLSGFNYYKYQQLFDVFAQDIDPNYFALIEVATFHIGLAMIFMAGVILKYPKLILVYFSLFLWFQLQRYGISFLGITIPEVKLLTVYGVPAVFIVPQILAIIFLLKKLRKNKIEL